MDRERALLRAALRRGDVAAAARAWSRLRVRAADGADASAGHTARAALGRALRAARLRRAESAPILDERPTVRRVGRPRGSLAWRLGAVVVGAALLALTLLARQAAVAPADTGALAVPSGAPASPPAADAAGRGRVSAQAVAGVVPTPAPTVTRVVVVASSPAPTAPPRPTPSSTVRPTPTAVPTPSPTPSRTPSPTPSPSPFPTPTPSLLPGPLPSGYSRITIGVGDLFTRQPIAGACISLGAACGPATPHTNELGVWWWDFPTGSIAGTPWQVTVSASGYRTFTTAVTTTGGDQQFIVPLVPAR